MDLPFDHVLLSRIQFGATAMFHILWPVLTIGLSIFLLAMEILWLKTGDEDYFRHFRFWSRLFLLNFTVGAVTGIPMEFQFGTNWSGFSRAGGDVLGHMLGFEAAMAFMLEACFLAIMMFGWKRVPPPMHLLATAMVALGSSLSAFWIMDASSWMHTPAGGHLRDGIFVITSHMEAIFNPDMVWGVSHMWAACLEITVFVVGGVSAWYLYKKRHTDFFLKSFKLAAAASVLIAPLQVFLGDGSGLAVFKHQPTKLAGMEAHWDTNPDGQGAPWHILAWPDQDGQRNLWSLDLPNALSLITTHSMTGRVPGLKEFPKENQPPVWAPFYAFRVMVATGTALVFVMLWTLLAWRRGDLAPDRIAGRRKLLLAWMIAAPVSYVSMEAGWVVREVGRQPWMIYGLVRTDACATALPPHTVASSLVVFAAVYALLFFVFLYFARRIIVQGPGHETPPALGQK